MATQKHRINISLSDNIDEALVLLARRDRIPRATKAVELLKIALELEEDGAWGALAGSRDKKGAKFISHKKAWS